MGLYQEEFRNVSLDTALWRLSRLEAGAYDRQIIEDAKINLGPQLLTEHLKKITAGSNFQINDIVKSQEFDNAVIVELCQEDERGYWFENEKAHSPAWYIKVKIENQIKLVKKSDLTLISRPASSIPTNFF